MSDDFREHNCMECAWSIKDMSRYHCSSRTGGRISAEGLPVFEWMRDDCPPSACPTFVPNFPHNPNSPISQEEWKCALEKLDNLEMDIADKKTLGPLSEAEKNLSQKGIWLSYRTGRGDRAEELYRQIRKLPAVQFPDCEEEEVADGPAQVCP